MVDRHLMDQMEAILSRLSIPVTILDKEAGAQSGDVLLPLRDGIMMVMC